MTNFPILEILELQNNRLVSLPDGIFDSIANLMNDVNFANTNQQVRLSQSAVLHPAAARIEIADDDAPLSSPSLSENPAPAPPSFPSGRFPWLIFNTSRLRLLAGEETVYQVRGVSARVSDMIVRIRSSHPQLIVEPQKLIFTLTPTKTTRSMQKTLIGIKEQAGSRLGFSPNLSKPFSIMVRFAR